MSIKKEIELPEEILLSLRLDELKKDLENCSICKGNLEIGNINHIADLDNFIIIIKNVPANVCIQCGEYYLEHKVTLKIEKIIENYRETAAELVIINYFDLVA